MIKQISYLALPACFFIVFSLARATRGGLVLTLIDGLLQVRAVLLYLLLFEPLFLGFLGLLALLLGVWVAILVCHGCLLDGLHSSGCMREDVFK